MKVLTGPTVTVVAKSVFVPHGTYSVPNDGTDMERLGAFSAKGCYDSFGENGRPCVDNQREVIAHKHGSVLEHSYASLFIEGVSRALTLEMNRHRLLNISQRSTRYTKEEDAAIVLEPFYAQLWDKHNLRWEDDKLYMGSARITAEDTEALPIGLGLVSDFVLSSHKAVQAYVRQVHTMMEWNPHNLSGFDLRKWARGKARNILPHALETRVTYTANMRAWRWFIEARSDRHAEAEIRRLAENVLVALKPLAPIYFEDFHLTEITNDNIPEYKATYSKV